MSCAECGSHNVNSVVSDLLGYVLCAGCQARETAEWLDSLPRCGYCGGTGVANDGDYCKSCAALEQARQYEEDIADLAYGYTNADAETRKMIHADCMKLYSQGHSFSVIRVKIVEAWGEPTE